MSGGLGGTGLVADDLYLMAHHETSGRPFLQPRPLGIGLAGALLAELTLGGHVLVGPDSTVAVGPTLPDDDLARQVRNQIAGEPEQHLLLEWLLFLWQSAARGVGRPAGTGRVPDPGRSAGAVAFPAVGASRTRTGRSRRCYGPARPPIPPGR